MATSFKRAQATPKSAASRAPVPAAVHCFPPLETLTHSSVSVSVGSLRPGLHKVCLSPCASWWEWGLILNANQPLLPSFWGFSLALGHEVSPYSHFSSAQPPLQCLLSCWGFYDLEREVNRMVKRVSHQ